MGSAFLWVHQPEKCGWCTLEEERSARTRVRGEAGTMETVVGTHLSIGPELLNFDAAIFRQVATRFPRPSNLAALS